MTAHGDYDDIGASIRLVCKADGVLLIVLHGFKGSGASVQVSPEAVQKLPELLRYLAVQIESDLGARLDAGFAE